ncbi:MAG: hydrogenase iron-sulfur subunit [Candidatus Eremiobacteraeota bacterium]|nr:hydrogenase iron-sulfur subunit [Candidatus Eremiobacteraeota bacterium]
MITPVVAFCCENSAYLAADACGSLRIGLHPDIVMVRVPCIGSVKEIDILRELEEGARGVVLAGCHKDACHHLQGTCRAEKRVEGLGALLRECGIDSGRVRYFAVSPREARTFAAMTGEFAWNLTRGNNEHEPGE